MQTAREFLFSKGLAKAPSGRGRFSAAAHAALIEARAGGMTFSDDVKPETSPKVVKSTKAPKAVTVKPTEKVDPAEVRKWAKANGHTVGERGRIHTDIVSAYLDGTVKEDRPEVVRDLDEYGPTFTGRYPEGTKFEAIFTHKGKEIHQKVNDRTACFNCSVSLSGHHCNTPAIVTGYGNDPVALTVTFPKGVTV